MSTNPDANVLVVGAGPVGLSMAIELLRRGVSCRIIDQNSGPTPLNESRALGIQARTMEVFRDMGVADAVEAKGKKIRGVSAFSGADRVAHLEFAIDDLGTRYPYILILAQSVTERVLLDRLAELGGTVDRDAKLTALTQYPDGVTATIEADGTSAKAQYDWLVGCDGAKSVVRKALGLTFEGGEYPERFLLADVRIAWKDASPADDEMNLFLTPEGPIVAFPFPEPGRWRLVDTTGIVPGEDPDAILGRFRELIHAHVDAGATIDDPAWTSAFHIHRRVVGDYRSGRCFVAGDAAHIHSPAGGQGMNTGIQDAVNLAWKLALVINDKASVTLLDSYTPERKSAIAGVLKGSDLATRAITIKNELARHVRDKLMSILSELDVVRDKLSRDISELTVAYRSSPIVAEHRVGPFRAAIPTGPAEDPGVRAALSFAAGPHPGDRAPDVALEGGRWLWDVKDPTGHTLLAFDGTRGAVGGDDRLIAAMSQTLARYPGLIRPVLILHDASSPADWSGEVLNDPDGRLHRRYAAEAQCLYLIRPDGYVAYRSQPVDAEALRDYLAGLLR